MGELFLFLDLLLPLLTRSYLSRWGGGNFLLLWRLPLQLIRVMANHSHNLVFIYQDLSFLMANYMWLSQELNLKIGWRFWLWTIKASLRDRLWMLFLKKISRISDFIIIMFFWFSRTIYVGCTQCLILTYLFNNY